MLFDTRNRNAAVSCSTHVTQGPR